MIQNERMLLFIFIFRESNNIIIEFPILLQPPIQLQATLVNRRIKLGRAWPAGLTWLTFMINLSSSYSLPPTNKQGTIFDIHASCIGHSINHVSFDTHPTSSKWLELFRYNVENIPAPSLGWFSFSTHRKVT